MELGIIQITTIETEKTANRIAVLKEKIIPKCISLTGGNYTLVSPPNPELQEVVESLGGTFEKYTGWERDKSKKFRDGMKTRQEEWVCFWDDDIYPDDEWLEGVQSFLEKAAPGQYGFRLTTPEGTRHQFGEDWMQYPHPQLRLRHRPLSYDLNTGFIETSPTAYVSNSIVHRDAYTFVEPFGIFQRAPDVHWCFGIKEAGFEVGFILGARAYHLGDRSDNR